MPEATAGPGLLDAEPFAGERAVTPEVVREHNLTNAEYERILEMLGRPPTLTELGVFSALWSEHCSYKHSKPVLSTSFWCSSIITVPYFLSSTVPSSLASSSYRRW